MDWVTGRQTEQKGTKLRNTFLFLETIDFKND